MRKNIIFIILILFALSALGLSLRQQPAEPITGKAETLDLPEEKTASAPEPENVTENAATESNSAETIALLINGAKYSGEIIPGESVYDLMQRMMGAGKINFTTKRYVGMGMLIDSIDGSRSNGEMTWIYEVNGKEAEVGVSNYKLYPGDVVSWKYEKLLAD
jgi:hypothetical protein